MARIPRQSFIPMLVTFFLIGYISVEWGWVAGLTMFIILIGLPSLYVVTVYYMGTALTARGDLRGAIAHYSRLLKANEQFKFPINRMFIHSQRAALRNATGDLDGAIHDYSAAMEHAKQEIPALYGIRSALYLGKRDYESALQDSTRLLELEPKSEIGYANRAAARMFLGDVEGAIRDCNTGLEDLPKLSASGKALLYNNRGTAYRLQKNYGSAMADYNLAMSASLKPRQQKLIHPSIMTNQGILYYLMQEVENARVYFQQALDKNPKFYKAMAGLALSRFKLGQATEATKLWKDLLAFQPRYRDLRVLQRDMNLPNEMMSDITTLQNETHGNL
ncbi:MAG: tetratricopeptide repeat protein [Chloroflexota bacterium]